jgi:PPK2 family polyphosphate:nucleotide phosphotransferase
MKLAKIVKQCRIDKPRHFKLTDHDPAESFGLSTDIKDVQAILSDGVAQLGEMQQRLYAHGQWAVLLVFQGMDAAGKDGVVKHVMSGINPQGCAVHSFKAPSAEELAHDFLWRTGKDVPERGRIGIFNRSHYEEVLVVRVHPKMLDRQNLPPSAIGKDIWKNRFKEIRAFERRLTRNGTLVLKFHLHISKEEQRNLDRLCALVRRSRRPQACLLARRIGGDYRDAGEAQARIPQGQRQRAQGAQKSRTRAQVRG